MPDAARSTISRRLSRGHGPDRLRQEIPLDLQLADLLVKPGDTRASSFLFFCSLPLLVLLPVAEDIAAAPSQLMPSSMPGSGRDGPRTGRPVGPPSVLPSPHPRATLALNDGLCFLRSFDMSHSSFNSCQLRRILGAGLSLSHLSRISGSTSLASDRMAVSTLTSNSDSPPAMKWGSTK